MRGQLWEGGSHCQGRVAVGAAGSGAAARSGSEPHGRRTAVVEGMPTHAEVIAQNPLEAPAPFWDNVFYAFNGLAAFLIFSTVLGAFVLCCLGAITRLERLEDRWASERLAEPKQGGRRREDEAKQS
mmetsp:Transcript_77116/g.195773  ORF Transcript_77116/g.195773 Transcript_77116/m.195773 type:complete len:127 (+) Transcript_77116:13-393(+)